jgi:hypothetical protein
MTIFLWSTCELNAELAVDFALIGVNIGLDWLLAEKAELSLHLIR